MKMSGDCWRSDERRQRILARRIECDQGLKTHIGLPPPTEHRDVFLGFSFDVVPQLVVQFLVRLPQRNNERSRNGIVNRQCSGPISDPPLLIPQSNHRIDARRMSRGHIACREGNHDKKGGRTTEGQ